MGGVRKERGRKNNSRIHGISGNLLRGARAMSMSGRSGRMPPVAKAAEEELTLAQVMQHMRTGQLISGPVKPYKWLDLTSQPKTQMELNVERVMEGCTFKSAMSCVVG